MSLKDVRLIVLEAKPQMTVFPAPQLGGSVFEIKPSLLGSMGCPFAVGETEQRCVRPELRQCQRIFSKSFLLDGDISIHVGAMVCLDEVTIQFILKLVCCDYYPKYREQGWDRDNNGDTDGDDNSSVAAYPPKRPFGEGAAPNG